MSKIMNTKIEQDMEKLTKRSRAMLDILNGLSAEEHRLLIFGVITTVYANLKLLDNEQQADYYLALFLIGMKTLYEKKDCIKVSLENKSLNIVIEDLINERNKK